MSISFLFRVATPVIARTQSFPVFLAARCTYRAFVPLQRRLFGVKASTPKRSPKSKNKYDKSQNAQKSKTKLPTKDHNARKSETHPSNNVVAESTEIENKVLPKAVASETERKGLPEKPRNDFAIFVQRQFSTEHISVQEDFTGSNSRAEIMRRLAKQAWR